MSVFGWIILVFCLLVGAVSAICCIPRLFYIFITLFKKPRTFAPAKKQYRYGVLICARNESRVIADLIKSVQAQDYPQELLKVYVLADNCTDNTADIARDAGAVVFERFNEELIGKGYAMGELFRCLKNDDFANECDGYFVFDADNLLARDYISRMNDAFDSGARLVTGFRNSKNFCDNWISASQSLYFLYECYTIHLPRTKLNISTTLSGTGYLIAKDIIDREGGKWKYFYLTEDIQCSLDQMLKGEQVVYCNDAEFFDEQPVKFAQSWKQRKRWVNGSFQSYNEKWLKLFLRIFKKGGHKFFDIVTLPLTTGYFMALGIFTLTASVIISFSIIGTAPMLMVIGNYLLSMYALYILTSLLLISKFYKRVNASPAYIAWGIFCFPFFMAAYIPITLMAILRADMSWAPIEHGLTKKARGTALSRTNKLRVR